MAENTAPMFRSAEALVVEVSAATCETKWALFTLCSPRVAVGLRRVGRVQVKRAACGKRTQPVVRERAGTPEPSSNRMQADSTWDDVERSGDGHPRVERERWRELVIIPRTSSNHRRLTAPRPDYPAR